MQDTPPRTDASVIAHLTIEGARAAMDLYARAFGAELLHAQEMPDGSGRLIHGAVRIGNTMVMVVDAFAEYGNKGPKALGGTPVTLHIQVPDCDAAVARAAEAGCIVMMPPADMFWGDRFAKVQDPYGHEWSIGAHVRDVTADEMAQALKGMCGG